MQTSTSAWPRQFLNFPVPPPTPSRPLNDGMVVVLDPLCDALKHEAVAITEIERRRDEHTAAVPHGRLHDADDPDRLIAVLTLIGFFIHVLDAEDFGAVPASSTSSTSPASVSQRP